MTLKKWADLNHKFSPERAERIRAEVRAELRRDERVQYLADMLLGMLLVLVAFACLYLGWFLVVLFLA